MSSSHSPAYGGRFALGWAGGKVKQWRVKHARDEAVAALRGGRGRTGGRADGVPATASRVGAYLCFRKRCFTPLEMPEAALEMPEATLEAPVTTPEAALFAPTMTTRALPFMVSWTPSALT